MITSGFIIIMIIGKTFIACTFIAFSCNWISEMKQNSLSKSFKEKSREILKKQH